MSCFKPRSKTVSRRTEPSRWRCRSMKGRWGSIIQKSSEGDFVDDDSSCKSLNGTGFSFGRGDKSGFGSDRYLFVFEILESGTEAIYQCFQLKIRGAATTG